MTILCLGIPALILSMAYGLWLGVTGKGHGTGQVCGGEVIQGRVPAVRHRGPCEDDADWDDEVMCLNPSSKF